MPSSLVALLAAKITALSVLAVVSLLVYRAFPQRYLLLWNGAWLIYLGHVLAAMSPATSEGLLPTGLLLAAQAVMAGAVGLAVGRRRPFLWLLPLAAAALMGDAVAMWAAPRWRGWPATLGYLVLGLLAAAWVIDYGRGGGWAGGRRCSPSRCCFGSSTCPTTIRAG